MRRREAEAPDILAAPLPRGVAGVGGRGAGTFSESCRAPGGVPVSRPLLHRAGASLPSSRAQLLPDAYQPLRGDKGPGCGRVLTLFSWKWKPSFRQRGRKEKSQGGGAKNSRVRACGGLGLAGGAGEGRGQCRRGCSCTTLLPAVEFFRVFLSHHVESVCNGSILKEKETREQTPG